ncbi:MAG: cyclic peptide export ABC transporter [Nostoc sp.]|uniref:cyclic peptide export ABC transporter n=1 Tax=Nostoc sp. TaxID=1180 RepID=UPI002FF37A42
MNLIWLLLHTSKSVFLIAIFTGLLSGSCSARLIVLINNAVSYKSIPTNNLLWNFIGLTLVTLMSSIISQILLIKISQKIIFNIRISLSTKILSCPLIYFEEITPSRTLAVLTDDIQSFSEAVFVIPFLCINSALILGCLIYLFLLSWILCLVTIACIVIGIFTIQTMLNRARYFLASAREENDNLYKHFGAIIEGFKELKLHIQRRKAFLSEVLQPTAHSCRRYNVNSLTIFATASVWGQLIFFITIGLLLFSPHHLLAESNVILASYVLTLTYLMKPLGGILEMLPALNKASVALDKIESLGLSLASNHESYSLTQTETNKSWKHLELLGVTHTYRREQEEKSFILGPINLDLYPGELVFLVGGNGSGKSTLAKLVTGLYSPEAGEIRLDTQSITSENQEWYRQHFSVVFADFYLFDRLLGLVSSELDKSSQQYLIQLQLENRVQIKDGILSTTLLSQGQRKRLALLTAYLEDRPIYVFDEWASDQDPLFKDIFYNKLLPELKNRGKAVLVISHDNHYFYLADRIIKMDYGKLEFNRKVSEPNAY